VHIYVLHLNTTTAAFSVFKGASLPGICVEDDVYSCLCLFSLKTFGQRCGQSLKQDFQFHIAIGLVYPLNYMFTDAMCDYMV